MMKYISLFSGIGAFEKALDNLGVPYELVAYCEIDKYASKSYAAIHGVPETMNLGDITKVDEKSLPKDLDLITYGFPCQDISAAGKTKGLFNEDGSKTRSGLFFDALRIIEETRPKVAIAENVKNLLSKKFTEQFELVKASLDAAGYNSYYQILNAKDFGVPQNRERVFIVSIRKDIDVGWPFTFPEGFPLQFRLKDVLEDMVDEKFYLSDKAVSGLIAHKQRNIENGNGFGFQLKDEDDIAPTLRARYYKDGSECLIKACENKAASPQIIQVAQMYGTDRTQNPQAGRIYDTEGISPTMDTCSGGNRMPKILVREATKKGYAEAHEGDSVNFEQPNSKTRRGRVGKQMAHTLNTTCNLQGVVVSEPNVLYQRRTEYGKQVRKAYESGEVTEKWGNMKEFVPRTDGIANTLSTVDKDNYLIEPVFDDTKVTAAAMRGRYDENGAVQQNIEVSDREHANALTTVQKDSMAAEIHLNCLRIRRLTPKECFRLMGFDDADFEKAASVNSNSQLYKQAGNSIVVPVLEHIFHALFANGALENKKEGELIG